MTTKIKHLSAIANDVLQRCAMLLDTTVEALVEEFETNYKHEPDSYARKLVEFCCSKALTNVCCNIDETIGDGSFSRFTFDMMVSWEKPSSADEESYTECVAKEKEDATIHVEEIEEEDEIPLFYSNLMPLLVDDGPSVGEDAFIWLGSLVPLAVDVVTGRFSFETLTASRMYRLYFPGYDKFLREIEKCIKQLQKQRKPKGVELADDEFILHVEGTLSTQRVIRHIGSTSWPGRLTLTNYALYFETSGVLSYEDALMLDLSKDIPHSVKPAATGPWGAPLFDKAIVYESAELEEGVVFEFPEMTSSTRRDLWLALIKEIILLHQFLSKYKVESLTQAWEMHTRTILGIIRLHAAREMHRISPPAPKNFLIFALFDELPKGDFVLEELAGSLKNFNSGHPCSGSSILRRLNMTQPSVLYIEAKEEPREIKSVEVDTLSSLESTINQVREEAKEVEIAKATTEELKEEGIADSVLVLTELLKPLKEVIPWFQEVLSWKRPVATLTVIAVTLVVIYKEWVGKVIAALLLWAVAKMLEARRKGLPEKCNKIVVYTASDKTTMESIVSAQHGLRTAQELVQSANIAILKIWSIPLWKAPKHAKMVMLAMTGLAIVLAIVPLKFILMAVALYCFAMNSKLGRSMQNEQGTRRLNEWWDSIPVIPVEVTDKVPDSPAEDRPLICHD